MKVELGMDETLVVRDRIALTCKGCQVMLRAAEAKAEEIGVAMCIAIVDAGGELLAFSRMDGGHVANGRMALTKAISAATRGRATADELKMRPEDPIQAIRSTLAAGADRVTSLSGGIPIVVDGQIVGAIGVSMGHREQDIAVAQAGIDALLGR
jgi:glc operon protein GlcG